MEQRETETKREKGSRREDPEDEAAAEEEDEGGEKEGREPVSQARINSTHNSLSLPSSVSLLRPSSTLLPRPTPSPCRFPRNSALEDTKGTKKERKRKVVVAMAKREGRSGVKRKHAVSRGATQVRCQRRPDTNKRNCDRSGDDPRKRRRK